MVRLGIICDEDVRPMITIEIRANHAEPGAGGGAQSGFQRDILEAWHFENRGGDWNRMRATLCLPLSLPARGSEVAIEFRDCAFEGSWRTKIGLSSRSEER